MISSILKILSSVSWLGEWFARQAERTRNVNEGRTQVDAETLNKVEQGRQARVRVNTDPEYASLLARELGIEASDDRQLLPELSTSLPEDLGPPSHKVGSTGKLRNIQGVMHPYSNSSLRKLQTCDPELQWLWLEVSKYINVTIVCGHRGKEDQNHAFNSGASKVEYPNSKHNSMPSQAVDAVPASAPKLWALGEDLPSLDYYEFEMAVRRIADHLGIEYRWGGDGDGDGDYSDQSFNDFAHFERIIK